MPRGPTFAGRRRGLEEGFLTPETQILDTGRYTYYKSPQPQCWL